MSKPADAPGQAVAERFRDGLARLRCPLCAGRLRIRGQSLVCGRSHCYDIARQGYVNLLPGARASRRYDADSFRQRRLILEQGFYRHVLDALTEVLGASPAPQAILDAGCGEGYYARGISRQLPCRMLATDLSRDAVQLAAGSDRERRVLWFVSDLARLPLQDACLDWVLNLYTPANYGEFRRVLRPGGRLLKAVPGDHHLQELRALAGGQLERSAYASQPKVDHFQKHFRLLERRRVSACLPLDADSREAFIRMTPLLFRVDTQQLDLSALREITVEAELLIGSA